MRVVDPIRRRQRANVDAILLRNHPQRLAGFDDVGGRRALRLGEAPKQQDQRQDQEAKGD